MIKKVTILIFLLLTFTAYTQNNQRFESIKNKLEVLSIDSKGLSEQLKVDINVTNITLSNFLLAVSKIHQVNLTVAPDLSAITLVNNFADVTVADLLVFLCKEYNLDIDFTGNILSIKKYEAPPVAPEERIIPVTYDAVQDFISLDLKNDKLYDAFVTIMNETGKKLTWSPDIADTPLTAFINTTSFDSAMNNLAFANNLVVTKNKDGFYLFEKGEESPQQNTATGKSQQQRTKPIRRRNSSFYYKVLDTVNKIVEVDFENIPIREVINDIGNDLNLNMFTAKPMDEAGTATFKTKYIAFDDLLKKMFESQQYQKTPVSSVSRGGQNTGSNLPISNSSVTSGVFTYKKEGNTYYFGTSDQLSVRVVEVIQLKHRSIELLGDPASGGFSNRTAGRTQSSSLNFIGGPGIGSQNRSQNGFQNNGVGRNTGFNDQNQRGTGFNQNSQALSSTRGEALIDILPDDIVAGLDVKMDAERNSFLVSGPATNVSRFKSFLEQIDKPIPVILIEVIILEVNKTATIETGINWGIGEEPVQTRGGIFPNTDVTLGAETVNRIIGGFDGFTNIGRVVPNFFANIRAMEANGLVKIRSTPKLSTLNGHRATLSIGETTYASIC